MIDSAEIVEDDGNSQVEPCYYFTEIPKEFSVKTAEAVKYIPWNDNTDPMEQDEMYPGHKIQIEIEYPDEIEQEPEDDEEGEGEGGTETPDEDDGESSSGTVRINVMVWMKQQHMIIASKLEQDYIYSGLYISSDG